MNDILMTVHGVSITPWKLVGYLGVLLFASRWLVQMHYSRRLGQVAMPRAFWWLSIAGSGLLVAYFTFGRNDSVGILANLFPAVVAIYNLSIDMQRSRRMAPDGSRQGASRPHVMLGRVAERKS